MSSEEKKIVIYSLGSMLIGVSIMLWPFSHLFEVGPLLDLSLTGDWPIYIATMLIVVALIDSGVAGVPSLNQGLSHIAWVVVMGFVAIRATSYPNGVYLLALLWFIHSFRSFPSLWLGERGWWLWVAWSRDCTLAILLFIWSTRVWITI